LWRVPTTGGEPTAVPGFDDHMSGPAIARRGRRMIYSLRTDDRNIWRLELPTPNKPAPLPVRLIASTRDENLPSYSPDGRQIVFGSDRSGNWEIWRCEADGANPAMLTNFSGPFTSTPRWSPDGTQIAFDSRAAGQADIYVLSADGKSQRRLTSDPADHVAPSWSRGGHWIYFGSNRGGEQQIWKAPAAGGEPVPVTKQGGYTGFESADGATLYYWKAGAQPGIWQIPTAGGAETRLHAAIHPHYWGSWAVAPSGLYFIVEEAAPDHARKAAVRETVRFFRFDTREITNVVTLEKPSWGMTVSPDGKFLLYAQYDARGSDLMLVDGWP
jgi:Tol biopolymer transport system component